MNTLSIRVDKGFFLVSSGNHTPIHGDFYVDRYENVYSVEPNGEEWKLRMFEISAPRLTDGSFVVCHLSDMRSTSLREEIRKFFKGNQMYFVGLDHEPLCKPDAPVVNDGTVSPPFVIPQEEQKGWITIATFEADVNEIMRVSRGQGKLGNKVAGYNKIRWILKGTGEDESYPDSFIYGSLRGTPVRHHKMPSPWQIPKHGVENEEYVDRLDAKSQNKSDEEVIAEYHKSNPNAYKPDEWSTRDYAEHIRALLEIRAEKAEEDLGLPNNSTSKESIMRRTEFNKLVESVIDEIRARLITKGAEYADNENVFRNFDQAAHKKGITAIQALEGMLAKHQVSIDDIVSGKLPNKRELVWEKFLDELCYRILEMGLLRRDEQPPF